MNCLRPLFRIGLALAMLLILALPAQSAPARTPAPANNPGETIDERTFFGWMALHIPLISAADAAGLPGILVLFSVLVEDSGSYRYVTSTLTAADGTYSSGVLPAGTYRVRALPEASPGPDSAAYAGAAYREDDSAPAEGTPITIGPGAGRDNIDLVLEPTP